MRCTTRACLPLRALCVSRPDLFPLLWVCPLSEHIRRMLRLDHNELVSLPATVFNGLTSLRYVASSPSTHTRTHARRHISALARTDTRTDETLTSAAALLSTCLPLWV